MRPKPQAARPFRATKCGRGRLRAVEWRTWPGLVPYEAAIKAMEERVGAIRGDGAAEAVWLLEHPPLITAGTSASYGDVRQPGRFPVFETGRGGQLTYHGPGQRVVYLMLDLNRRGPDLRRYVHNLEALVIDALSTFGVNAERRAGRVGLWVVGAEGEAKIAAIGVRVRRWVTYHGIAINVGPNLEHFEAIVPCGISDYGVTSLERLGVAATLEQVDAALKQSFAEVFGDAPSLRAPADTI